VSLHFSPSEFQNRQGRLRAKLKEFNWSGLLIFKQESMYWLAGYDTAGYSQFQCLWFGQDGRLLLLTRSSDVRQARSTSVIDDVRLWVDAYQANPAATLRDALVEHMPAGSRVGVEYASATLNAQRGKLMEAAFEGHVALEDASDLVSSLRVIKSPAELEFVRTAGRIADQAWKDGLAVCRSGNSESDILAEMYASIARAGGDPAAGRFVCGASQNALLCRYFTGKGTIAPTDQVTIEFAGAFRHYHAALMRTVVVGKPSSTQIRMHDANVDALAACREILRPGTTFGELFAAHANVLDDRGFRRARLNACGYSLGAAYPPTWMEWPMSYADNPVIVEPGMVIFLHMIQMDSDAGLAMTLGETFVVTDGAPERLSDLDHNLPIVD